MKDWKEKKRKGKEDFWKKLRYFDYLIKELKKAIGRIRKKKKGIRRIRKIVRNYLNSRRREREERKRKEMEEKERLEKERL